MSIARFFAVAIAKRPGCPGMPDAPLLERGDESVLCEFLGKTDIADDARETGDDPGRLNPPDCVDGADVCR